MLRITAALLAGLLLVMLAGCAGRSKKAPLRVGVRSDIQNFAYLNPVNGKYHGMEIDLARELATRLGYEDVQFTTVTPETRQEMLLNGDVDCLIACYSITEERQQYFDFSEPYYYDDTVALVESSTGFTSIFDLTYRTIGVLEGSTAEDLFTARMATMNRYPASDAGNGFHFRYAGTYEELSEMLERGDVDAICLDGSIAQGYMSHARYLGDEVRTRIAIHAAEQSYGVATVKDSALSGRVAEAVSEMLEDGTIDELNRRWF